MKIYTFLEAEAMLCIWEEWCEMRHGNPNRILPDAMANYWDRVGTVHMRLEVCPVVATWCLAVYDHIKPEQDTIDGFSYDWDIIPAILTYVEWDQHKPFLPGPSSTAKKVLASFKDKSHG